MIFNTAWFLVFSLAFYPLLFLLPGPRARLVYVVLASAVFHTRFAGPAGVAPIVVMAVATYAIGLALPKLTGARRRTLFVVGLAVPVGGLVFYKYHALLLAPLLSLAGVSPAPTAAAALPLAISFFTFEFVHYLVDVEKGSEPVRSPLRFALFSIFFPSIVSGPVKRYQTFLAQVADGFPAPRRADVLLGAARVLVGFGKKLVVADTAADAIRLLEGRTDGSPRAVVLLMALLSVRILFDFSGYSDIAIGLGRMAGVTLPENFSYPYAATGLSDFWHRWHMSLSSWIRDYVYIPLGGGRQGALRKGANVLAAMFLCGLWHGAEWHFGLWGLYHGAGLAVENVFSGTRVSAWLNRHAAWRLVARIVTVLFVAYGWLLFFYPVNDLVRYTRTLLGLP